MFKFWFILGDLEFVFQKNVVTTQNKILVKYTIKELVNKPIIKTFIFFMVPNYRKEGVSLKFNKNCNTFV